MFLAYVTVFGNSSLVFILRLRRNSLVHLLHSFWNIITLEVVVYLSLLFKISYPFTSLVARDFMFSSVL